MTEPEELKNEPNIDPRLMRLRVELFAALQTLKGEDLKYFEETIDEVSQCMTIQAGPEPKPTYGSLVCSMRYDLLEKASKALEGGNYELACNLLNAYAQVK